MPKRYDRAFRRAVGERLVAGEKVRSLAGELGVSEATLYLWRRQALIDAGRAAGVRSFEADELAQARRTIAGLETDSSYGGVLGATGAVAHRTECRLAPAESRYEL